MNYNYNYTANGTQGNLPISEYIPATASAVEQTLSAKGSLDGVPEALRRQRVCDAISEELAHASDATPGLGEWARWVVVLAYRLARMPPVSVFPNAYLDQSMGGTTGSSSSTGGGGAQN